MSHHQNDGYYSEDDDDYYDNDDDGVNQYDPDFTPGFAKGGGGRAKGPTAATAPRPAVPAKGAPSATPLAKVGTTGAASSITPSSEPKPTTTMARAEEADNKLRPSHDIFNRIMWDPQLCADDFDIGYEDRFAGVLFMPARKFRGPESDEDITIPFHRIRSFRYRGTVIWDRDARIDVLDTVCVQTATDAESDGRPSAAKTVPTLRGGDQGDVVPPTRPFAPSQANHDGIITVATFNILHPLFDTGSQFTALRIPLIAAALANVNADIVFLQEVTEAMFSTLRDVGKTVFEQYYVAPPVFGENCRTAQATLSKFPLVASKSYATAKQKRVLMNIVEVPTADNGNRYITTANVHLISDMAKEAAARRQDEIKMILALVESAAQHNAANNVAHEAIIAGDFNFGDQSPDQRNAAPMMKAHGMVDTWREAHRISDAADEALSDADIMPQPDGTVTKPKTLSPVGGFTFDTVSNRLAANNSEVHRYPRRLDRIFARGLTAVASSVFGNQGGAMVPEFSSSAQLLPSDHYGVVSQLQVGYEPFYWGASGSTVASQVGGGAGWEARVDAAIARAATDASVNELRDEVRNAKPSRRCAMVVSVPEHLRAAFDAIRATHDHAYPRWMPHCTLLYPFVEPSFATPAMELVQKMIAIGRRFGAFPENFAVPLKELDAFTGARKSVVFAKPDEHATHALIAIHRLLQWAFPQCTKEAAEDEDREYNPHFTLGQCAANVKAKTLQEWSATWPAQDMAFDVNQIDFVAHLDDSDKHELLHAVDLPATPANAKRRPQRMASVLEPVTGRKQLQPYLPDDKIEGHLALRTSVEAARSHPTHISQLGGMYTIDENPDQVDSFLTAWAQAVRGSDATSFFVEEIRTDIFRLYFDVDLPLQGTAAPACLKELATKLCEAVKIALKDMGRGDVAVGRAVVLQCHGPWEDASPVLLHIASKAGLRLYFQSLFTDLATYAALLDRLPSIMKQLQAPLPPDLVVRTAAASDPWPEVLDTAHSVSWERARLMGTIKRRRIRHLDRRYRFFGVFSEQGIHDDAMATFNAGPLEAILFATKVRKATSASFVRGNDLAASTILRQ